MFCGWRRHLVGIFTRMRMDVGRMVLIEVSPIMLSGVTCYSATVPA